MKWSSIENVTIGIVGPIDISLITKEKMWSNMPRGNEYPMFSYYVNYLLERNIKVHVYTTSPSITQDVSYVDGRLAIFVVPQRNGRFFKNYFLEARDMQKIIQSNPSTILFAQWTYEYGLAALYSGARTIVTINDNACKIFSIKPTFNKLIKLFLNRLVLNKSKQLIAVSKYIYNNLNKSERNKTAIIPNFYPSYLETKFVEYKDRGKTFVTFCNGFGRRTNVKKSIKAFRDFCNRNKEKRFVYHLIGKGTEVNSELYSYSLKIKAPIERMCFHGYLSHPQAMQILSSATLLIHPSLEEANSITIIESMALGVPVIGNILSKAVKEQLSGPLGYLCNTKKENEICHMIEFCINNPDHCSKNSILIRSHALDKYNIHTVIGQHLSLI